MKRKLSGAEYRKAKNAKMVENQKLSNSIKKFLNTSASQSTQSHGRYVAENDSVLERGVQSGGVADNAACVGIDAGDWHTVAPDKRQDKSKGYHYHEDHAIAGAEDGVGASSSIVGHEMETIYINLEKCAKQGEDHGGIQQDKGPNTGHNEDDNEHDVSVVGNKSNEKGNSTDMEDENFKNRSASGEYDGNDRHGPDDHADANEGFEGRCVSKCMGARLSIDAITGTIDPAMLVDFKFKKNSDKELILNLGPWQPNKMVLSCKTRSFSGKYRYCSQQAFHHADGTRRQWLSYSRSTNALFCLPCLLFSDAVLSGECRRVAQGNAFKRNGFSNWKKQHFGIMKHETSISHQNAVVAQAMFLQDRTIESALSEQAKSDVAKRRLQVERNRKVMRRIVNVISFLGAQSLPLRGHTESLSENLDYVNRGNFLEVLNLLSSYDNPLKEHLDKTRKMRNKLLSFHDGKRGRGSLLNFLSSHSQNKIARVIGDQITAKIVADINTCRAWAVIADTTPDINHHEQLSICVRIVSSSGDVSEHLLACKEASGTTAQELFDLIFSTLQEHNVSLCKLVAQTYDGAANMSGPYRGLQALFRAKICDNITFIHCYAHVLNLVLSDTACVTVDVCTLFGNLETMYLLFCRSHKANKQFEEVQASCGLAVRSLKRLNTVRWSARELCLLTFLDRYECIAQTLEQLQDDTTLDSKMRSECTGILSSIRTKQFMATAYLFREIFVHTGPLSRYLQAIDIDFFKAQAMVNSTIESLQRMRNEPESILRAMEKGLSDSLQLVQWSCCRIRRRKIMPDELHFNNQEEPAANSKDVWLRNTFYIVMDTVLSSMRERFEKNAPLFRILSFFSPSNFAEISKKFHVAQELEEHIDDFCKKYNITTWKCAAELISFSKAYKNLCEKSSIIAKSECKETKETDLDEDIELVREDDDTNVAEDIDDHSVSAVSPTSSICKVLKILCNERFRLVDAYPELCKAYSIILAIPVSSCTAERSFSAVKRVKTRLRSTMIQSRLQSLLLMSVERKILLSLDCDAIIDHFARTSAELSKALL